MIFEIVGIIVVALISSLTTRWLLTRKSAYGYFYIERIDPEDLTEVTIRVSLPSSEYYLDKNQIILKKGNSQK